MFLLFSYRINLSSNEESYAGERMKNVYWRGEARFGWGWKWSWRWKRECVWPTLVDFVDWSCVRKMMKENKEMNEQWATDVQRKLAPENGKYKELCVSVWEKRYKFILAPKMTEVLPELTVSFGKCVLNALFSCIKGHLNDVSASCEQVSENESKWKCKEKFRN